MKAFKKQTNKQWEYSPNRNEDNRKKVVGIKGHVDLILEN